MVSKTGDPFLGRLFNYSSINGDHDDVYGDADSDGVWNYDDSWPYDGDNGTYYDDNGIYSNDNDGDGIENDFDPAPDDPDNYSYHNNTYWHYYALEDSDNDGEVNFYDPYPNDTR
ncbi:MAG: hypothetical protein R3F13_14530 [Prosthecobacter sp.]